MKKRARKLNAAAAGLLAVICICALLAFGAYSPGGGQYQASSTLAAPVPSFSPDEIGELDGLWNPGGNEAPPTTGPAGTAARTPAEKGAVKQKPAQPAVQPAEPENGLPDESDIQNYSREEIQALLEQVEKGEVSAEGFSAAAWASGYPANFAVSYTISSHTAACSWSAVTSPVPTGYRLYKWSLASSYSAFDGAYSWLTGVDAGAQAYYDDWYARINANMSGLTYTEKQAALNAIEASADALNNILCDLSQAGGWNGFIAWLYLWSVRSNAVSTWDVTGTSYNDTACDDNNIYWYAVATLNGTTITSAFSHSEYFFAVRSNTTRPAAPTGVTATAYDDGVYVEWARNTEYDLAGYNVYDSGGTKLNASLITTGTEFHYATGTVGQVYRVAAVDTSSNESATRTPATAVAAPITTYGVDDAATGWTCTPSLNTGASNGWKVEKYPLLPGGDAGPANLLVAQSSGALATHSFYGRQVKLFVSTYFQCGYASVQVDGNTPVTVNLSNGGTDGNTAPAPAWGVNVFHVYGLTKGNHTFKISATGTSGVGGFSYVNVQYIEVR